MPRYRLLSPQDYVIQKWKNGLGSTSQLYIQDPSAKFPIDPYLFRISSARVNSDGPFSLFPGYDRYLVLVEGKSLRLDEISGHERGPLKTLLPMQEFLFAGEREIHGMADGQDLIDYNVVFRRASVSSQSEIIHESFTRTFKVFKRGERLSVFVTCLGDALTLEAASLGLHTKLGPWHSALLEFEASEFAASLDLKISVENPSARGILSQFHFT